MHSKFAAISNGTAKVSRLIISQMQSYSALQTQLDEFVKNPDAENAEKLDSQFEQLTNGLESIRNAIGTVAQVALGQDVEAIDVVEDEKGYRL